MFKRNVIANFFGKVWPSFLGLVFVPIYLHYLGIEAYGLVGFLVALQGMIGFLDMGLSTASNREVARSVDDPTSGPYIHNLIRTLEFVYWGVSVLIAGGFLLSSGWLATEWVTSQTIPVDVVRFAVIIFGFTLALRWPIALYGGVLRGFERQVLLNLISVGIATLRYVGAAIVIIFVSRTIFAFLIWQFLSAFIEILLMTMVTWRMVHRKGKFVPRFDFSIIKRIGRFSISLTLISILASTIKQFDRIAITRFLSLEAVGYYTAAYTVYELLSYFVSPIVDAAFPRFSNLLGKGDQPLLAKMYHQSAQMVSFLIAPAATFIALFSHDILLLWTRSPDVADNGYITLSVLALAYAFNALMHLPVMLQYAAGIMSIAIWLNILGATLLLPFMFLMISKFGLAGAGISWLIFNLLNYLIVPHFMHRRLLPAEKKQWILKDTLAFLLLCWALMGGAYAMVFRTGDKILVVAFEILAVLVYGILCMWIYPSLRSLLPIRLSRRQ